MFVNGFIAGQEVARTLAQIVGGEQPPVFTLIWRAADGSVANEVISAQAEPTPDVGACMAAVADAETRGLEAPAGLLVSGNRLFVFTGPSVGQAVLVHTVDGAGRIVDRQLGQRGEERDLSTFLEGFDDGLGRDDTVVREGDDDGDPYELGWAAGIAFTQSLLELSRGALPLGPHGGTIIARKRGEQTYVIPVLPDLERETFSRWVAAEDVVECVMLSMPKPGLFVVDVQPDAFTCSYRIEVDGGIVRTSTPGVRLGKAGEDDVRAFLTGLEAGVDKHSGGGELSGRLGALGRFVAAQS